MKIFSTFSGIGGFEIGIQSAFESYSQAQQANADNGHSADDTSDSLQEWGQSATCIGYSEIDKYASSVYEKHYPGVKNYGDITKINAEDLPDFDCLVGGFPCQAFSIAGKRGGFDDTRGTLFFDLARILRAKQPRLFVFENVKGLLSHDNGNTFRTIIQTIDELGYDCQWQVLNSKNFGVPQNRERVYIVGHLRGTPRPEVFPIGEANKQDIVQLNHPTHSNDRVYDSEGISPTLNTMQGGNRQPFIAAQRGRYNADGKTEQKLEPRYNGVSSTLTAVQKDNMVVDPPRIRRLTPKECERLQGFPDDWTRYGWEETVKTTQGRTSYHGDIVPISDTQRYKMCGNAVTTNVVQAVFERIFNG